MKNENLSLGDVQETALIPLSNRAMETLRKKPRIHDDVAVKLIRSLNIDTKQYDKVLTHECVIARTIMFDDEVKKLLKKYKDAVCINIGCGLDDRYRRVDNGTIIWYDVDLKDSIAVRRKIFVDTDRRKMIIGSVLENEWMKQIHLAHSNQTMIVIAEGLFMYFSKEDNQKILQNLASSFAEGYLIVEMMQPVVMNEKHHETVKKTNAKFGWGTKSGHEFELLEPRMHLLSEQSFSVQMMKSTFLSRVIGFVIQKFNNRIAVYHWCK